MNPKEFSDQAETLLANNQLDELETIISQAQHCTEGLTDTARMWLQYYDARLQWSRQKWRVAEGSLRNLVSQDLPVDLRARALRWLGESHHYGGQWQEQTSLEQEALVLSSVLDDDSNRPAIYNLMGWNHLRRSRYHEALGAFEHSLRLCQGAEEREQEAWALNNLGVTYLHLGETDKAIDSHQAALVIRREAGLRLQEGRSLYHIAEVLIAQGHWRQADKYLRDSEAVAREVQDSIGLSYVMYMRGEWEKGQGWLDRAIDAYRQCLTLRTTVGSPALIAEAHWALGDTYRQQGQWLKAADHAEQAATAWRDVVRPWPVDLPNGPAAAHGQAGGPGPLAAAAAADKEKSDA